MPPIHNPETFRLSEEGKRKLRIRIVILAVVVISILLTIPLSQYLGKGRTMSNSWIFLTIVLFFTSLRFYQVYRYMFNFELTFSDRGILVGQNLDVRQIFFEDISRIVRTKRHLAVIGRYPGQTIVIPASIDDFDRVERMLQAIMPITYTGKRLPMEYTKFLLPERLRRRSPIFFFLILGFALLSFLLTLLFTPSFPPLKPRHIPGNVQAMPFSVNDSLEKYRRSDTMIFGKDFALYSASVNNIDVGVYQRMKNVCLVFKTNGRWDLSEPMQLPVSALYAVAHPDLNGDHHDDLLIYGLTDEENEMQNNVAFLYDPHSRKFTRNRFYDLPEVEYDSIAKRVHADLWTDSSGVEEKRSYRISGDSLIAEEGVIFTPDPAANSDKATVEFYSMKSGKQNVTRTYQGKYEQMYALFQKSIWVSEDEEE